MKKNAMKELDRDRKRQVVVDVKSRLPAESKRRDAKEGMSPTVKGRELLDPKDGKKATAPTTLSEVDMTGLSEDERKKLVSAIRREYQRQYYQKHKEKAKEYQRQYNLTHKKKVRGGRGKASFECPREKKRMTFNTADLMHSPSEKTLKMLKQILSGDRIFTM
jgi:hypothetical protein